ncbi:MAG: ORF6N domain-containing protein [Elusimicrobiota bacterium]|nr:ORF6N domain-containing protein [Elusimicrobiota bacterium]
MKKKKLIKTLPKTVAISVEEIESRIIELNGQKVILDSGVAELYGVQTRDINKAVKNNPGKFPQGYIYRLTEEEKTGVVENFHHLEKLRFSPQLPKAFTEKGLYMLATILKSSSATATAIAIIETFAKLRKLTRNIKELSVTKNKDTQKSLMRESGGLATEIFADNLTSSESETSIELNFAVLKVKHTIKKTKK